MTGYELYKTALAMLSQLPADNTELELFAPGWLNVLLQEALETENTMRRARGLPRLCAAPTIDGLEAEIDYREELLRTALPYGLAAYLYTDDENDYRAQDFRARFIGALGEYRQVFEEPVTDLYGGDADA